MFYTLLKYEDTVYLWVGVHNVGLVYIIDLCSVDDFSKLEDWSNQYNVDITDIKVDNNFPRSLSSSILVSLLLISAIRDDDEESISSLIDSSVLCLQALANSAAGRALLE